MIYIILKGKQIEHSLVQLNQKCSGHTKICLHDNNGSFGIVNMNGRCVFSVIVQRKK